MEKDNTPIILFRQKLLKLQKAIKPIKKEETNPFFNSRYFDINGLLAEIKPHMNEIGLVLAQPIEVVDGKNVLKTFIYEEEGGEYLDSCVLLPEGLDPQKFGAAITYYRRYAIQSLLSLEAEDDDGNAASQGVAKSDPIFDEPKPRISQLVPSQGQQSQGYANHFEAKAKVAGNKCNDCPTGMYYKNPKTGKTSCDQRCWLNKQEKVVQVLEEGEEKIPF